MNDINILIVEDEPIVAMDIQRTLTKLEFNITDMVSSYDEAIESVKSNKPDIILMDIYLQSSKSGIEITKELQKTEKIPIIYLTAYSDEKTVQEAASTNPDGYILKPFKREELKSIIMLTIYKINNFQKDIHSEHKHIGHNFYYDFENENLYFKEKAIKLSKNENKFLKLLIESQGQIVEFSTIKETIWPNKEMSDSTLRTQLYRLRSKLEFKLIDTIPSFGCKLNK